MSNQVLVFKDKELTQLDGGDSKDVGNDVTLKVNRFSSPNNLTSLRLCQDALFMCAFSRV
jgi:hypothetical protein